MLLAILHAKKFFVFNQDFDVVIINAEKRLYISLILLFTTSLCVGIRRITKSQRHQKHVDVSVEQ